MEKYGIFDAFKEEINYPRFWILLVFSLAAFFISSIWEYAYLENINNIADDAKVLWPFRQKTWISVVKEIGFASMIALMLSIVVERSSRARQEAAVKLSQKQLAKNVFSGVFENNLPKEMVDEVLASIFESKVIRLDHKLDYLMDDVTLDVDGVLFVGVQLKVTSQYSLKNVSSEPATVKISQVMPIHPAQLAGGRDITSLETMIIGDQVLNATQIEEGNRAWEDDTAFKRYRWERLLQPGEVISVRSVNNLIKDRSDNELWTSLHPTLNSRLAVVVNCAHMEFGASAHHRRTIKKLVGGPESTGSHQWELVHPILPYQGITFWWRPKMLKKEV